MLINFWGAPGSGKTVAAMEKTVELKKQGFHAIFLPEPVGFAFGSTNDEMASELSDHFETIEDHPNVIFVTDMPVALSWFYDSRDQWDKDQMLRTTRYTKDYLCKLGDEYQYDHVGRKQSYDEACTIEYRMQRELDNRNIHYELLRLRDTERD